MFLQSFPSFIVACIVLFATSISSSTIQFPRADHLQPQNASNEILISIPTSPTSSDNTTNNYDGDATPLSLVPNCIGKVSSPSWQPRRYQPTFDPAACAIAIDKAKASLSADTQNYFTFYSRRGRPWRPTRSAVDLPQGSQAYTRQGACAFVIRMKKDFSPNALPFTQGGFLQPGNIPIARETWGGIFQSAQDILKQCLRADKDTSPGWITAPLSTPLESAEIVVSFWPVGSDIDNQYGIYVDP